MFTEAHSATKELGAPKDPGLSGMTANTTSSSCNLIAAAPARRYILPSSSVPVRVLRFSATAKINRQM